MVCYGDDDDDNSKKNNVDEENNSNILAISSVSMQLLKECRIFFRVLEFPINVSERNHTMCPRTLSFLCAMNAAKK